MYSSRNSYSYSLHLNNRTLPSISLVFNKENFRRFNCNQQSIRLIKNHLFINSKVFIHTTIHKLEDHIRTNSIHSTRELSSSYSSIFIYSQFFFARKMSEASKSPTNSPHSPIVVPPFPSNEDRSEVEQFQAPPKSDYGIGVRFSELSDVQKIINGSKPKPSEVRQFTQRWRYQVTNSSDL